MQRTLTHSDWIVRDAGRDGLQIGDLGGLRHSIMVSDDALANALAMLWGPSGAQDLSLA